MEELPLTASQEVFSHPRLDEIAKVHRGVIDGAHFCVASPLSGENNCLLIHCHGFRPENTEPFAEIDDSFWLRLVQQGWTVGVTSYRRNGIVVQDAIRDVLNLRNWVGIFFFFFFFFFLNILSLFSSGLLRNWIARMGLSGW